MNRTEVRFNEGFKTAQFAYVSGLLIGTLSRIAEMNSLEEIKEVARNTLEKSLKILYPEEEEKDGA